MARVKSRRRRRCLLASDSLLLPTQSGTQRPRWHFFFFLFSLQDNASVFRCASAQVEELRPEDFSMIAMLGRGNGGSVLKVVHAPTNLILARKVRVMAVQVERRVSRVFLDVIPLPLTCPRL